MAEPYGRMDNGVMHRTDGRDTPFAARHRLATPRVCYLFDEDGSTGAFYDDSDGHVYTEVQFGDYLPGALIRDVHILAMFEAKAHEGLIERPELKPQTASLLRQCRNHSLSQPYPCRFFFLYDQVIPFTLQELDIYTGARIGGTLTLPERDPKHWRGMWEQFWRDVGLLATHEKVMALMQAWKSRIRFDQQTFSTQVPF